MIDKGFKGGQMDKKKILIIDDDPDFIKIMTMQLQANNYNVVSTTDGKNSLGMIKNEKPDAVLLDVLMPDQDGLKLLEKIRKQDKDLPVFIVTAFSDEARFGLAKRLDASGFLVKTGDFQKEIGNITSVLRLSGKFHQAASE